MLFDSDINVRNIQMKYDLKSYLLTDIFNVSLKLNLTNVMSLTLTTNV